MKEQKAWLGLRFHGFFSRTLVRSTDALPPPVFRSPSSTLPFGDISRPQCESTLSFQFCRRRLSAERKCPAGSSHGLMYSTLKSDWLTRKFRCSKPDCFTWNRKHTRRQCGLVVEAIVVACSRLSTLTFGVGQAEAPQHVARSPVPCPRRNEGGNDVQRLFWNASGVGVGVESLEPQSSSHRRLARTCR